MERITQYVIFGFVENPTKLLTPLYEFMAHLLEKYDIEFYKKNGRQPS